jgi:hypothetical protein
LEQHGMSAERFALAVGLKGRASLWRIMTVGTCRPGTAARIELATGGEVPALEVLYADRSKWQLVRSARRQGLMVQAAACP